MHFRLIYSSDPPPSLGIGRAERPVGRQVRGGPRGGCVDGHVEPKRPYGEGVRPVDVVAVLRGGEGVRLRLAAAVIGDVIVHLGGGRAPLIVVDPHRPPHWGVASRDGEEGVDVCHGDEDADIDGVVEDVHPQTVAHILRDLVAVGQPAVVEGEVLELGEAGDHCPEANARCPPAEVLPHTKSVYLKWI